MNEQSLQCSLLGKFKSVNTRVRVQLCMSSGRSSDE